METAALAHPRLKSNSSFQIMHRFFYDTEPNTAALDRPVPSMSAALKKRFKNPHLLIFSNSRPLVLNTQRQRSEEHTSELQSRGHLVCRLLLEKKKEEKSK